jgi:transcriptional regulator with XRE-family HTH domain
LLLQLRAERQRRGVKLIELADQIGYHRVTISRWERGIDYPSIAALGDWCQALDYNLQIRIS